MYCMVLCKVPGRRLKGTLNLAHRLQNNTFVSDLRATLELLIRLHGCNQQNLQLSRYTNCIQRCVSQAGMK